MRAFHFVILSAAKDLMAIAPRMAGGDEILRCVPARGCPTRDAKRRARDDKGEPR